MEAIRLEAPDDKAWREGRLPEALHRCRAHPQWSSLNPGARPEQAERQQQLEELVISLQKS